MFCFVCGQELPAQANFCFKCGNHVNAQTGTGRLAVSRTKYVWRLILGVGLLSLILLLVMLAIRTPERKITLDAKRENHAKATPLTEAPRVTKRSDDVIGEGSPTVDVTLHPLEMVQNPFAYLGKIVSLNVLEMPTLYNGSPIAYLNYAGRGDQNDVFWERTGFIALRFNKMLTENEALYDVMGQENGAKNPTAIEHLAVVTPSGSSHPLNVRAIWQVESLGRERLTNELGGPVDVAKLRFWEYREDSRIPRRPGDQNREPSEVQTSPDDERVYRASVGISLPVVIRKVEPDYSEEGSKAKLNGSVLLYMEVDKNGSPRNVRVLRSLGLGLDEKAVEAVQQWRFAPGRKDGKAVNVALEIVVNFKML
jgi:TonB family protein